MRRILACVLVLVIAGCANSTGPIHGISLSGNNQTDSIGDTLRVPLTVHSLAHVPVTFYSSALFQNSGPVAWVEPLNSNIPFGNSAFGGPQDSTNGDGLLSVRVWFGATAGVAEITITAGSYSTEAHFTITPGKPVSITMLPHDTAIFGGASLPVRVAGVDRVGNLRSDASTIGILSGPATASGKTVTTTGVGRVAVVGSTDGFTDTSYISAVPKGTLAVLGNGIQIFNLDGSNSTIFTVAQGLESVRWSPSGKNVVYAAGGWIYDTPIVGSGIHAIDYPTGYSDHAPVYSRDGTWIYFYRTDANQRSSLWRIHPDGTGVMALVTQDTLSASYPSPSPDGTQVAYVATSSGGQTGVRVLTLSTGAFTSLNTVSTQPAWSPNSNAIAAVIGLFAPDFIATVNTTNDHQLGSAPYFGGFDWSPDGQWLVAANATGNHLDLINVTTGVVLPLVFTGGVQSPAWKPTYP